MSVSKRIVYKNGIVRPENKGLELSCICECADCKSRYEYSKYNALQNVSCKNRAYMVVWEAEKINEAMEVARKWICQNGNVELKTENLGKKF